MAIQLVVLLPEGFRELPNESQSSVLDHLVLISVPLSLKSTARVSQAASCLAACPQT